MKTLNLLLLMALSILNVMPCPAQANDPAQLVVHYASRFKFRQENPKQYEDEQVLEIGAHHSAFYGLWNTRREAIKDSILARGGSHNEVIQAWGKNKLTLAKQNYAVYKNYPQKGKLTYTDKVFKKFKYVEQMERPTWTILAGDTLIHNYPCQKAQTSFRGRTWIVWFTPSIPTSEGPWKLHGLPGLILKAQDTAGDFSFSCIRLQKGKQTIVKTPEGTFIECTPKKLAEMHAKNAKSLEGYLQNFGYKGIKVRGADGKPLNQKEQHPVLLEILP